MANEIRRRTNFVSGPVNDNPLASGATTLTSSGLSNLPAITSADYAVIVLDPLGLGNGPEVVYVTAHTASATTATIVRGREGTSGVQHASTMVWVHLATAADWGAIGDANDQPSTGGLPYEGMRYVDTTNDVDQMYSGSAWIPMGSYGAWTSYTPSVTNGTLGNGTIAGRYARNGRLTAVYAKFTLGSSSVVGSGIGISLPVDSAAFPFIGNCQFFDNSAGTFFLGVALTSTGTPGSAFPLVIGASSTYGTRAAVTGSVPFTWAQNDYIEFTLVYESAS